MRGALAYGDRYKAQVHQMVHLPAPLAVAWPEQGANAGNNPGPDAATLPQNLACWAVTAWLAAQAPPAFGPPVL